MHIIVIDSLKYACMYAGAFRRWNLLHCVSCPPVQRGRSRHARNTTSHDILKIFKRYEYSCTHAALFQAFILQTCSAGSKWTQLALQRRVGSCNAHLMTHTYTTATMHVTTRWSADQYYLATLKFARGSGSSVIIPFTTISCKYANIRLYRQYRY